MSPVALMAPSASLAQIRWYLLTNTGLIPCEREGYLTGPGSMHLKGDQYGTHRKISSDRRPGSVEDRAGGGALSTEPTPLPLFDVIGKSLTVRGYILFEITGDPQRLERANKFMWTVCPQVSSSR